MSDKMWVPQSSAQSSAAAELLRAAERSGHPIGTSRPELTGLDWAGARTVARERDALRIADGDTAVGYKLGWTSAVMRDALGVSRPNWGTLWRSMELSHAGRHTELDLGPLIHPKAEPEIACLTGRALGAHTDPSTVLETAAGWAVALEVVDPRYESYTFTSEQNTADNSSAARFALGNWVPVIGDPSELVVEMLLDGEVVGRGAGSAALGGPAIAVAWLADSLAAEGDELPAGSVVLTGGLTAPVDLVVGIHLEARSDRLGAVALEAVRNT
jgi:2-keto-4-pentenoate hydratase